MVGCERPLSYKHKLWLVDLYTDSRTVWTIMVIKYFTHRVSRWALRRRLYIYVCRLGRRWSLRLADSFGFWKLVSVHDSSTKVFKSVWVGGNCSPRLTSRRYNNVRCGHSSPAHLTLPLCITIIVYFEFRRFPQYTDVELWRRKYYYVLPWK